ncbi:hypothetical protein Tco_1063498 [Tanacetum coccineum]
MFNVGASTASLMFSFNATSATNLFSQAQFRTPTASFNNNNQMSIEDSLHEDFIQTSSPAIPTFAPASAGKQLFASGTPTPSLSTVPFIFGVQTNQPPSQIPFQVQTNQYHKGNVYSKKRTKTKPRATKLSTDWKCVKRRSQKVNQAKKSTE